LGVAAVAKAFGGPWGLMLVEGGIGSPARRQFPMHYCMVEARVFGFLDSAGAAHEPPIVVKKWSEVDQRGDAPGNSAAGARAAD